MSDKIEAIQELQASRKSKVISYITGDRAQFPTQINEDIVPILLRHLQLMGKQKNIDLFLYTRGGDMVVPIRIVKLIRGYCDKFSVLIPYRCHSAGTLICLGADEIIMTKIAEMTPVDPTSQVHFFNPIGPNPANLAQQIVKPVSVEDVRSYLDFARKVLSAQDSQIVDLYSKMSTHLHPLALGNVYRVQKMIKQIAKKLLDLQFKNDGDGDNHKISKIIREVTEDISIHNYPIYLDEAQSLELKAKAPTQKEEDSIWKLFELFSKELKLTEPFNPLEELGGENAVTGNCYGACLESENAQDVFDIEYQILKIIQPPQIGINVNITKNQWSKIR